MCSINYINFERERGTNFELVFSKVGDVSSYQWNLHSKSFKNICEVFVKRVAASSSNLLNV